MPDGAYYLKIVASDAISNPPAQALAAERESERFVVDNTPPVIEALQAKIGGSQSNRSSAATATISFTARDSTSSIERAQYSIDGADWTLVTPKNGISDAPEERYEFSVTMPESAVAGSEHTIAVRAYDRFENVGSAKTTVKLP
jgi:hypothetical protein